MTYNECLKKIQQDADAAGLKIKTYCLVRLGCETVPEAVEKLTCSPAVAAAEPVAEEWFYQNNSGTVRDRQNHCLFSAKTFGDGGTFDAARLDDAEKILRLAASAPALLAALETAAAVLDNYGLKDTPAKLQIRAAIAQARGESLDDKFEAGWQKSIAAGSVRENGDTRMKNFVALYYSNSSTGELQSRFFRFEDTGKTHAKVQAQAERQPHERLVSVEIANPGFNCPKELNHE